MQLIDHPETAALHLIAFLLPSSPFEVVSPAHALHNRS